MKRDQLFNLLRLVGIKDSCTAGHTWRVALYAQALAKDAGLEPMKVRRLMRAAALHDIGKIDVPVEILTKPSPLTDDEFQIVKQHAEYGYNRLLSLDEDDPLVLDLVRSHHERVNGSGYPDGLGGDAIPLVARFFAVIDSFDAMTSIRPYRRATGREAVLRAVEELRDGAGRTYCKESVDHFTDLLAGGRLDWILRNFNDRDAFALWSEPTGVGEIDRQARSMQAFPVVTADGAS